MSYVINNSRGELVAIIPDGTVNTTATSLSLVGQGVTNYGTAENENYVYLLENFASSTPPTKPITGQLWYNTATDTMSVWQTDNTWNAFPTKNYVDSQKVSPAFTGVPTAPTAAPVNSSNQLATTAFVQAQKYSPAFSGIPMAPLAEPTDNSAQIATTAFVQGQKDSPIFTGIPQAPTANASTNTDQIATTAFVQEQKNNMSLSGIPTAPTALVGTNNTQIATTAFVQAQKVSPAFTGTPTAPTAAVESSSTQLATTAFVQAQKNSPIFTGTPQAPTPPLGSSNTQIATTAFVVSAVSGSSSLLGTMSTQNSNGVNITGGSITGIVDLAVADGGTGSSTAAGARSNLGLGSMATQDSNNVNITGGSITGVVGLVPSGIIVMWSGSAGNIPSGWLLCNGTSGTPNLLDRFIVGAGSSYNPGATGGTADAVVVSHTHTMSGNTSVAGSHQHSTQWTYYDGGAGRGLVDPVNPGTGSYYIPTTFAGDHSHSLADAVITPTGVSGTGKNLPPYYALCYIMKA